MPKQKKSPHSQKEEEVLKYWQDNKIFEKSLEKNPKSKPYVFYDGPPFATGLPHYGHILASVIKDAVPRYWTMKGYHVRRRWGWDCHGLPIESLIEKELKISGKKEIEEKIGVEKFNEACGSKVLLYTKEWKKMIDRIGRWIEFDNAYKTMDSTYMESVWWALKTIWDKNLIYEGRKVLMYCPRCETPVSKAEIAMDNSYKDITEESVTAKFKVKNPQKYGLRGNTYILAWTTTPWTLPGNVALAIGKDIDYVLVKKDATHYVLAAELVEKHFKNAKILETFKGEKLIGVEYEPLFEIKAVKNSSQKAWYITDADFVTTEEGTGVVHTAVIYGEDDYNLGLKIGLPMVPTVNEQGDFNNDAPEIIRGVYFKNAEKIIKDDLEKRGLLFDRQNYTHSYPHCWRCDTQLFYNAISAWFINIQKVKPRMIELNEKINWYPEHLKHGRFGHILETAPDWNISRNRYWATPLPFWKCDCGYSECIGSVKELKEKALNFSEVYSTDKVEKIDLHKHNMDKIKLECKKCGASMNRIPEVIDCWVESSSMPFAEFHYPFENEKTFEKRFPGEYIAEYIAQTRAWFYYMHAVSTLLFDDVSFKNCVTTGTILNEKGEKLSKSKMNYTDPWAIIDQYGVDALRYYLLTGVVMQADNLSFNDREVRDIYNKVINILWNVVSFYKMYKSNEKETKTKLPDSDNILDKWILAKLQILIKTVSQEMDNYNTVKAGRPIKIFIDELSTWYLRRSRDRLKGDDEEYKAQALTTLKYVLLELSKLMAPFTPFIAERVYKEVDDDDFSMQNEKSVHLENWPEVNEDLIDQKVLNEMEQIRKIVEMGMSLRKEAGIRVRQPLGQCAMHNLQFTNDLLQLIKDELNIKEVISEKKMPSGEDWIIKEDGNIKIALNTELTPALKKEGIAREVVRSINQIRKNKKLTINDAVEIQYFTEEALTLEAVIEHAEQIQKDTLSTGLEKNEDLRENEKSEKVEINGVGVWILIKL